MSVKIIVLNDGETWAGGGTVMEITDEAHESLCCGDKEVKHLSENEIITMWDVDMADTDSK